MARRLRGAARSPRPQASSQSKILLESIIWAPLFRGGLECGIALPRAILILRGNALRPMNSLPGFTWAGGGMASSARSCPATHTWLCVGPTAAYTHAAKLSLQAARKGSEPRSIKPGMRREAFKSVVELACEKGGAQCVKTWSRVRNALAWYWSRRRSAARAHRPSASFKTRLHPSL